MTTPKQRSSSSMGLVVVLSGCSRSLLAQKALTFRHLCSSAFVPVHEPVCEWDVEIVQKFIDSVNRLVILTGAGISTESGLPDYRSESVGLLNRPHYTPIVLKEFVLNEHRRKSYWARNFLAWNRFKKFKPNMCHLTLHQWQSKKPEKISAIVTQNVDRLHQKAGSENVIELHGHGYTVACIKCDYSIDRESFQKHLEDCNPGINVQVADGESIRPDGDMEIAKDLIDSFKIPHCPNCQGLLKPTIIFFGDNVPKVTVDKVYSLVSSCDGLLVIGSSLHVYSGYRFVLKAHELNKQIVIINIGPTRADHLNKITFVRKKAGELLPLIQI